MIVVLEHSLIHVALQNNLDQADILVIRHTTTVVDLCADVVKHLVRNFIISLDENFELTAGNVEIFVGERVGDVPADGTELSAVLDDGVEESESE